MGFYFDWIQRKFLPNAYDFSPKFLASRVEAELMLQLTTGKGIYFPNPRIILCYEPKSIKEVQNQRQCNK
jgi:hypothetical protein